MPKKTISKKTAVKKPKVQDSDLFIVNGKPAMNPKRALSWSAMYSFGYDKEQWYRKYVLGQEDPTTREMEFGKMIGEKLATDPKFMPHVPRYKVFEYELRTTFAGIPLVGFIDGFNPPPKKKRAGIIDEIMLGEYKTGKTAWTQTRADQHGQISMYLLMLYIQDQIKPEDVTCHLHWMPTKDTGDFRIEFINEKDVQTFETKRTTKDILMFGKLIKNTYKEMQEFAENHE